MNNPDIRTVTITDLAFGGDGMARVDDATVFVPYALPGDTVRVKMAPTQGAKNDTQKWAKLIDVTTPSANRLEKPPCTHCFDCGGCALQHMQMAAYQNWKYQSVMDRLGKGGIKPDTAHPMISIATKSRRRATFAARRAGSRVIVGFNRHHDDQVIDIQECHVLIQPIVDIVPGLRTLMNVLLHDTRAADISVTMIDNGLDVLITAPIELNLLMHEAIAEFTQSHDIARLSMRPNERGAAEVLLQPKPATLTLGGTVITLPAGAFLQPSRAGEQALIDCVMQGVGDAHKVADLFSGMGTFTYPLAARGANVLGVDVDVSGAVHKNITFKKRNLYKEPLSAKELSGYDAVIFDPPRAGAKAQAPEIARSGVSTIVAVSCNPGTFVTDCTPFLDAGYRFTDLYVVDQFTWSSHVEVAGVFRKTA